MLDREGRISSGTDFSLYLDASLGDKNDRATVYSKVISSAPVDVNRLYQHLIDWRFARERLQRLDSQWPDPSIQCGALISSVQKLRARIANLILN